MTVILNNFKNKVKIRKNPLEKRVLKCVCEIKMTRYEENRCRAVGCHHVCLAGGWC
jgi:hypothetical protein